MNMCFPGVIVKYILITDPLVSSIYYQINISEYEGIGEHMTVLL